MRSVLVALTLCLALPAHAEWGQFEHDFDESQKAWQEIQSQLPAAPKAANLIEVRLDASTRNRLYLDSTALSVAEDGVVRYVAVLESASGARNISFEGMRCTTGERKLYAFGRANGDWSRNRNARWEPIQARLAGGYHRELFYHYLCTVEGVATGAGNLPVIQRLLKSGGLYQRD